MTDTMRDLARLARLHGIATNWRDYLGRHRQVGEATLRGLLAALGVDATDPAAALAAAEDEAARCVLPPLVTADAGRSLALRLMLPEPLRDVLLSWLVTDAEGGTHAGRVQPRIESPPSDGTVAATLEIPVPVVAGYGRLRLGDGALGECDLAIAPPRCYAGAFETGRHWGLAAQIYGLRAAGDGGLGHFGALAELARSAAAAGADALAISPVHALFAADANHFSPYAPSNRLLLNGLLVDPGDVPGAPPAARLAEQLGIAGALAEAEAPPLIDYARAVPLRLALLRAAFAAFRAQHLDEGTGPLAGEFRRFRAAGDGALERHACFEALHAHHFGTDPMRWDWRSWPAEHRDPGGPAVAAFAAAHRDAIEFHFFLQWLAARQLGAAQEAARHGGMAVGLVADLAVGTHASGSRAWAGGADLLRGATIGAPPDLLGPAGQDWGLTTFAPLALAARGFAPFLAELRAAMRLAGGVRLDHVMGLSRIWCIPEGERPTHGAYLRCPADDLLRLVRLESHLHHSVVIGEDLGTLPDGFAETLAGAGLYGIRVLWFERDANGGFAAPERYSSHAIASTTTHDLPTLAGWWHGTDIAVRSAIGALPEGESVEAVRAQRERDRAALWRALQAEGLVPATEPPARMDAGLAAAVAAFLARTRAPLVLLPLEDALLAEQQPNLPGTNDTHPNWRRRLAEPAEAALHRAPAREILAALRRSRPRHPPR